MIWALVLAAGESRRMGRPKMRPKYGKNESMIERVLKSVLASNIDGIQVVLGAFEDLIRKQIKSYPVQIALNPDFRSGMLSSVTVGLASIPMNARAVMVILGDQPGISTEVINTLIEAFRNSDRGIILPVYAGRRGHPLLFDSGYREEIANLDPNIGLRQLLRRFPRDILEIPVEASEVLEDIDTPRDYQKSRK